MISNLSVVRMAAGESAGARAYSLTHSCKHFTRHRLHHLFPWHTVWGSQRGQVLLVLQMQRHQKHFFPLQGFGLETVCWCIQCSYFPSICLGPKCLTTELLPHNYILRSTGELSINSSWGTVHHLPQSRCAPNPQHLPCTQTSQNLLTCGVVRASCSWGAPTLPIRKMPPLAEAATLQNLKHCNSNLTWKCISTRLQNAPGLPTHHHDLRRELSALQERLFSGSVY